MAGRCGTQKGGPKSGGDQTFEVRGKRSQLVESDRGIPAAGERTKIGERQRPERLRGALHGSQDAAVRDGASEFRGTNRSCGTSSHPRALDRFGNSALGVG